MPTIARVRAIWTGLPTGNGVTVFYSNATVPAITILRNAFEQVVPSLPTAVRVQVENQGDTLDDATGIVNGTWATTAVTPSAGTAAGSYASAVGGVVGLKTGVVHRRRRLRGRIFIVPIGGAAFGTDGRLLASTVSQLSAFGEVLRSATGNQYVIWGRPLLGEKPADGSPAPVLEPGMSSPIVDKVATSLPAVLRSRRD